MNQFKRKWTLDRQKFLSEAEIKKLKRTVEDKAIVDLQRGRTTWVRFWMVIDLAVNTGMRVSELAGVKIEALYLNSKEPRIRVTGKGQKTRDVFISKQLVKHIIEYLKWKYLLGEPTEPDDYLLMSSHGRAFSTRTLQYAFKVSLKTAGLPEYYSIHACRHSYGTYLYKKTKDLRLVQKQLGHSNIATTTVYADVTAEETVEAVNGLFEEPKEETESDQATPNKPKDSK